MISLLAGGGGGYRIDIREPHTYFSFRLSRRRRECTCTYNIYTAMHTTHPGKEGVQTPSLFFFSPSLSPSPVFIMARRCGGKVPGEGRGRSFGGYNNQQKRLRRRNIHIAHEVRHMGEEEELSSYVHAVVLLSHTHTWARSRVPLRSPPTVLTRLGMGPERGDKNSRPEPSSVRGSSGGRPCMEKRAERGPL